MKSRLDTGGLFQSVNHTVHVLLLQEAKDSFPDHHPWMVIIAPGHAFPMAVIYGCISGSQILAFFFSLQTSASMKPHQPAADFQNDSLWKSLTLIC